MRYYIIHRGKIYTTDRLEYILGMTVVDTETGKYYMGGNWITVNQFDSKQ